MLWPPQPRGLSQVHPSFLRQHNIPSPMGARRRVVTTASKAEYIPGHGDSAQIYILTKRQKYLHSRYKSADPAITPCVAITIEASSSSSSKLTLPWQRHLKSSQWCHLISPSKSQNFCIKHFSLHWNAVFKRYSRWPRCQLKWDTLLYMYTGCFRVKPPNLKFKTSNKRKFFSGRCSQTIRSRDIVYGMRLVAPCVTWNALFLFPNAKWLIMRGVL